LRQSHSPNPWRLVPAVWRESGGSQAGEENGTVQRLLKRLLDDFLPGAVVELPLGDGNRLPVKVNRVVLRSEILDASKVAFHGQQGRGELFDLGAIRGVTFHCDPACSDYTPTAVYCA